MAERIDILLPDTEGLYRAWQEGGAIYFEAESPHRGLRWLGLVIVLSMALMPLIIYGITLAVLLYTGQRMPWPLHGAFGGMGLLFLAVGGKQALDIVRFRKSMLYRDAEGVLRLTWFQHGGRTRNYRIEEPAYLMVLLHHDAQPVHAWLTVTSERGETERLRFHDMVEVDLKLEAARVTPRMLFLTRRWVNLIPRFLGWYLREHRPDTACEATADATQPLADAVRACLGIPVVFHQAGGAFTRRLEVAESEDRD